MTISMVSHTWSTIRKTGPHWMTTRHEYMVLMHIKTFCSLFFIPVKQLWSALYSTGRWPDHLPTRVTAFKYIKMWWFKLISYYTRSYLARLMSVMLCHVVVVQMAGTSNLYRVLQDKFSHHFSLFTWHIEKIISRNRLICRLIFHRI